MIVITTGKSYMDIDAYGSCIAYRELLRLKGIEAKFVSDSTLNYSITSSLLSLNLSLDNYNIKENDEFIIFDVSVKEFLPDFVKEENIIELIDHHPGFEEYWNNKLGSNSMIEEIGSVATIVVERYIQSNLLDKMDKNIAKLLMAAILDNTLNFTANITKDRDEVAYKELEKIAKQNNFANLYFSECEEKVVNNLEDSIINDLKIQHINEYIPNVFGQLTIWNIDKILKQEETIKKVMNSYGNEWIINIISLKDNISYIMCSDNKVRDRLNKLFNGTCDNNILIVNPAMLRKEIIKIALTFNS